MGSAVASDAARYRRPSGPRVRRARRIFNMSKQRVGRAAEVAKLFHIFHFLDTNESGLIDEHEMKTFIQRYFIILFNSYSYHFNM